MGMCYTVGRWKNKDRYTNVRFLSNYFAILNTVIYFMDFLNYKILVETDNA